MKKIGIMILLLALFRSGYAQDQIINGDLRIGHDGGEVTGPGKAIYFGGVQSNTDALSIFRYNRDLNSSDLRINFSDDVETGADRFVVGAQSWVSAIYKPYFIVLADGRVAIGTEHAGDEKLSVKGKIRAQEIKVEADNWPDYVFKAGYKLPTLQEIEKGIRDTGHLPGIPSAKEVKSSGIDLGEMNARLLQKIEELTLHLIAQDKRLQEQELKIRQLIKK